MINAHAETITGTKIHLEFPSVGTTENIMLAAVAGVGETVIHNAAREPEISDLQDFLNAAGFNVTGAGTNKIVIKGGKPKEFVQHKIIPDRIVAGTFLYAAAITGSKLTVCNMNPDHISAELNLLRETGCSLRVGNDYVSIKGADRVSPVRSVRTMPYPGFPTDMQAQIVTLLSLSAGTSVVVETVFESRFKYVEELLKMGADIRVENRLAIVRGVNSLSGALVHAADLRGGAALVLAGLAAEGKTIVTDVEYIDRGYDQLDKKFVKVGASIVRIEHDGGV